MYSDDLSSMSAMGSAFADFWRKTSDDLFAFGDALKFKPTDQQVEIMRPVQELTIRGKPTHVAVKSGQGVGKTAVSSLIGLWRAFRRHKALTVMTAPTMRQCKVWLGEIATLLDPAPKALKDFFKLRATDLEILGVPRWGIKLATGTKADNVAGWHNPYLTLIVDEASGLARQILETFMGTLTNKDRLMLLTGNPTKRDSVFFDCFGRDRRNWYRVTLNAEDSPIVNKDNIERAERLYGRNSDFFRVRVLGLFPNQDPSCVMNSDDLYECTKVAFAHAFRMSLAKQFGIDFARFGDDESMIYRRTGNVLIEQAKFSKIEPDIVLGKAFDMQRRATWTNQQCLYVADAGGMGQGLMHHFYNTKRRVFEFHSEGVPADPEIFDDTITEAFFTFAERVKDKEVQIPVDEDLIAELSNRQYYLTLKGKLKLESKDDYKQRTKEPSPNKADACVMAYYDRGIARAISGGVNGGGRDIVPRVGGASRGRQLMGALHS